jgi:hypothetical protein
MKRHILKAALALSLAGVACSNGTGSGSLLDEPGAASGAPAAPGLFDTSNNPGPGGTPPPAGAGAAGNTNTGSSSGSSTASGSSSGGTASSGGADAGNASIDDRVVDYGEALRTASIKLIGVFPPLADIQAIAAASAADQPTLYQQKITAMLADPRFADTQIEWWRNTLKTGGPAPAQTVKGAPANPSYDTAATFAASVVVNGQPFTDILTASTGTCPTYANGTFTPASCNNNAPTSGVLTDPGIQSNYFSHMAMRRARFIQETFACSAFPAEMAAQPVAMGSGTYTSPWPFDSITGGATAKIDFQSTSAIICANCHTSINHFAPLFANFDAEGNYQSSIQVQTPVTPPVTSVLADWLPTGQGFAWRYNTDVTDIPSLGKAMAADPDVQRCAVTRVWNWAFSRGDVVNDSATVPTSVTDTYLQAFQASQFNMKTLIQSVFTSTDFVEF